MAVAFDVKRGDTLTLNCTRTDSAGNPVSLSGSGAATMRRRNGAAISLTYTVIDAGAGTFRLSAPASATDDWALGVYLCDVEFTTGAVVASTETFLIKVVEDITNAP